MAVLASKSIRFFVITVMVFVSFCSYSQKTKEKLQEDKKKLADDIAYTNKLLSETKKNKQVSLNQLIILNNKINQREELINTVNTELNDLEGTISQNSKETEKLNNNLLELKHEYAKMIVFAYKNRNSFTRLMFIFASSDFNQAFIRLKYLQQYTRYRKKQAEMIVRTGQLLTSKISELINIRSGKTKLLTNQENEKLMLDEEKKEKNTSVKKLQDKEKELVQTIKQKEKESKKLKLAIETVISEEIKKATEKSKTTTTTNTTNKTVVKSEITLTPEEVVVSNSFVSNKGKLPWPSEKGIVTSTFGKHPHPVLDGITIQNNGIDISTSDGAKARAVFEGKVTGVISIPGANKAVIIRHGEYLTVYSNLASVYVKTGDKVKIKQEIGLIYTDTDESKTELHFEIWNGKILTDPLGWLSPKK
jgi:murein hydrolase activator